MRALHCTVRICSTAHYSHVVCSTFCMFIYHMRCSHVIRGNVHGLHVLCSTARSECLLDPDSLFNIRSEEHEAPPATNQLTTGATDSSYSFTRCDLSLVGRGTSVDSSDYYLTTPSFVSLYLLRCLGWNGRWLVAGGCGGNGAEWPCTYGRIVASIQSLDTLGSRRNHHCCLWSNDGCHHPYKGTTHKQQYTKCSFR